MYKNLKTPAVECLENGNLHIYRKLFCQTQHCFLQKRNYNKGMSDFGS